MFWTAFSVWRTQEVFSWKICRPLRRKLDSNQQSFRSRRSETSVQVSFIWQTLWDNYQNLVFFRCAIRERLRQNFGLPNGIADLKIPNSLRRYVDLMWFLSIILISNVNAIKLCIVNFNFISRWQVCWELLVFLTTFSDLNLKNFRWHLKRHSTVNLPPFIISHTGNNKSVISFWLKIKA